MMRSVLRIGAVSVVAAALAVMPAPLLAQSTNKPAAHAKTGAAKKKQAHPFHGNLAAVDKTARTIKLGESIYQLTSETKITKDGKPAILDDAVVGEPVSGYAKPTADGKMTATTVHFGAKAPTKGAEKSIPK